LSIRIGERSRMALRFTHGIKATPVMFGFHFAIVTPMRATER
jgi:adenylosuccinate lyase